MMNEYLRRMRLQLPDFEEYEQCLSQPPYKGIRANTLKIGAQELKKLLPFALDGVPWESDGFYVTQEKPGKTPYHDAGLYYVQEPSAMCAAPLLDVRPGERVLDLCSAPGGKGTQLAQKMQGQGILVLNEKIPDRARILLQNVERMGVANAVVTCADPEALAQRFAGYFDKILVDAPCSGEGMLRKEAAAAENWSVQNVEMCAARQKKILACAVKMLAGGGKLVYSTCTFSEEEDERNAEWLLHEFPFLKLEESRKIYPHRERGEGHFAALFSREEGERARLLPAVAAAEKRLQTLWKDFSAAFLKQTLPGRLFSFGKGLCLVPEELFTLDGLKVLRAGLLLGEDAGGRFEPAHALALGAPRDALASKAELSEEEVQRYLRGEELPSKGGKGWCAVCYNGYPLGLAKDGVALKNHYPKGLRIK